MSSNIVPAEKRFRVSLLLDTYGELLTEKQRTFLGRYYEEDLSFGEIAREFGVSRQAIFDSVKHGEASLEHYEKVLGLVRSGRRKGGAPEGAALDEAARSLRALASETRRRAASSETVSAEWIAAQVEELAARLGSGADESPVAEAVPASGGGAGGEGKQFLRGGGPDID